MNVHPRTIFPTSFLIQTPVPRWRQKTLIMHGLSLTIAILEGTLEGLQIDRNGLGYSPLCGTLQTTDTPKAHYNISFTFNGDWCKYYLTRQESSAAIPSHCHPNSLTTFRPTDSHHRKSGGLHPILSSVCQQKCSLYQSMCDLCNGSECNRSALSVQFHRIRAYERVFRIQEDSSSETR